MPEGSAAYCVVVELTKINVWVVKQLPAVTEEEKAWSWIFCLKMDLLNVVYTQKISYSNMLSNIYKITFVIPLLAVKKAYYHKYKT